VAALEATVAGPAAEICPRVIVVRRFSPEKLSMADQPDDRAGDSAADERLAADTLDARDDAGLQALRARPPRTRSGSPTSDREGTAHSPASAP
jgi:hypothetical protein